MTPNKIEEQEPDQALEHKTEITGAGPEKHELGVCKQNRERWNSRTAPEIAHSEECDRLRENSIYVKRRRAEYFTVAN
jgi:hypothetical protein